ncbi:tripartite tricarboxylate transporter TctB family protein [Rossellomorea marisflavi]|uniref:tripartite tricarboxylate transporter TctB family protein n=1 Tax=Rossellomorea marisflavi TaxID=189381 RepID=UPI001EE2944C|nr:tripartite tricarboxylate transporter TctB family protein [Rossellomorea marisflavi]UKS66467.1 tripartite tricarboxylate transporter TctB family protein [Rossellomorea marisflavi]
MINTMNKKMGIILAVISIIYLYFSFTLPEYPYVPVDSDAVPIVLGFILLFLSVLLYFSKSEENEEEKLPKGEGKVILAVLGFVLMFILLLEPLGFVLTTFLFISINSRFLGYKKWVSNIIVSLALPLSIYFLFVSFLKIQLPSGILPF